MWSFVQQLLGYPPRENGVDRKTMTTPSGVEYGGDSREDGQVSYGFSLLRGKRATMEDFQYSQFERWNDEVVGLFGVFDGHGGADAATYVKMNLFKNMMTHEKFASDIEKATEDSYRETDENYLEQGISKRDDGCTAVTAVLVGRRLIVANVGDSRAVLCRQGKALQLTIDHKPNEATERQRIESLGGMVVWAGTWRVGGVLAVSRAFGDRPLKKFVRADPDLWLDELTENDDFIILASDGLWDVVSNEDAVGYVGEILGQDPAKDARKAAVALAELALGRGSNDNISCIIVCFNFS